MFEPGEGGDLTTDGAIETPAGVGADAPPRGVASIVDGATQIDSLSELDWTTLDAGDRLDLLQSLQRTSAIVRSALGAGLAALDDARITERSSGLSTAGWWARTMRACGGDGTWLVRSGHLMARFPELGAAVRCGDVPLDHLRVLDSVNDPDTMAALVALDPELCVSARRLGLTDWRRHLRRAVAEVQARLADEHRRRAEAESSASARAESGAGSGADHSEGTAPGAQGAGDADPHVGSDPEGGTQAESDAEPGGNPEGEGASGNHHPHQHPSSSEPHGGTLFDESEHDNDSAGWFSFRSTPEGCLLLRGELRGHAAEVLRQALLAESSRRRRAAWREHDETGAPIPQAGELRAQALIELVRRGNAAEPGAGVAPRTEAVVVIQADDEAADRIRALDGEPLDAQVASMLTCDAHLQALVVDQAGQPLWLGRSRRLASPAQRRALAVRDGGCVFPECDMPSDWCDVHHEPGWERGGASDLHSMVLLCRRHHGLAHTSRWELRASEAAGGATSDQRFEWVDRLRSRTVPAAQRGLKTRRC
jgi:hypothetical protein